MALTNEDIQAISQLLDSKLDEKLRPVNEKLEGLENDINGLKRQMMKSTAELKAMDEMILDEVERVHGILDKHKADTTKHTA